MWFLLLDRMVPRWEGGGHIEIRFPSRQRDQARAKLFAGPTAPLGTSNDRLGRIGNKSRTTRDSRRTRSMRPDTGYDSLALTKYTPGQVMVMPRNRAYRNNPSSISDLTTASRLENADSYLSCTRNSSAARVMYKYTGIGPRYAIGNGPLNLIKRNEALSTLCSLIDTTKILLRAALNSPPCIRSDTRLLNPRLLPLCRLVNVRLLL